MVRILTEESLHLKIVWRKEGAQQAFFPYNLRLVIPEFYTRGAQGIPGA